MEAIQEAEKGNLDAALTLMSKAIALTPKRASCFNNRAQIHRFGSNIPKAMEDLNQAINLGEGQGRSACQAFCQRGKYLRPFFTKNSHFSEKSPFFSVLSYKITLPYLH